MQKIFNVTISGKHNDIVFFRNGGSARIYPLTSARLARLSRHPNYYVSATEALGFGFSASIVRRLTKRAPDARKSALKKVSSKSKGSAKPARG